jgi:hypothetical protein
MAVINKIYDIKQKGPFSKGRQKIRVEARSLLCYRAV